MFSQTIKVSEGSSLNYCVLYISRSVTYLSGCTNSHVGGVNYLVLSITWVTSSRGALLCVGLKFRPDLWVDNIHSGALAAE